MAVLTRVKVSARYCNRARVKDKSEPIFFSLLFVAMARKLCATILYREVHDKWVELRKRPFSQRFRLRNPLQLKDTHIRVFHASLIIFYTGIHVTYISHRPTCSEARTHRGEKRQFNYIITHIYTAFSPDARDHATTTRKNRAHRKAFLREKIGHVLTLRRG